MRSRWKREESAVLLERILAWRVSQQRLPSEPQKSMGFTVTAWSGTGAQQHDLLLEETERDIAPDVAIQIDHHRIGARESVVQLGIASCGSIWMVKGLNSRPSFSTSHGQRQLKSGLHRQNGRCSCQRTLILPSRLTAAMRERARSRRKTALAFFTRASSASPVARVCATSSATQRVHVANSRKRQPTTLSSIGSIA